MPAKYVIHTKPVPHRFEPVTKSGIIAWEEGCLKCAVCVKKQCVYGVYDKRSLKAGQMIDSIDNQCMNCFRCVQNCPKELIHKSINPEFEAIGDDHWKPDIIARLWYQAETGKIPVSGAGYPGPFSGPGFDSMWTDMSEIVRPTRDGIHGREYISTAMDLGRTPRNLSFTKEGKIENSPLNIIDIPLPIIMRVPDFGSISEETYIGWSIAARRLGTFLALPYDKITDKFEEFYDFLVPVVSGKKLPSKKNKKIRLVEFIWEDNSQDLIKLIGKIYPSALLCARLPLDKYAGKKVMDIIQSGCSIINLEGSFNGRTQDDELLFVKDGIRSVHLLQIIIRHPGCDR